MVFRIAKSESVIKINFASADLNFTNLKILTTDRIQRLENISKEQVFLKYNTCVSLGLI